jgi:multidrug resistance efflux pump
VRQSAWREAQKARTAPVGGLVTEVFFRVGESVPPGQPVLALLPPGQVKARFFVPEAVVGRLQLGRQFRSSATAVRRRFRPTFPSSRTGPNTRRR